MKRPLFLLCFLAFSCAAPKPFWVRVADNQTGRAVPMVEFRAPNAVAFWTDSNGIAAIDDRSLEGRDVTFLIHSDGYEFPRNEFFGDSGRVIHVESGKHMELKIRRINIAERLYRVTGADIYRDSLLAGVAPPIAQPLLNGGVIGQDTNIAVPYQNRIFWCWGDTIGLARFNFGASCATSDPPARGGLDPSVGVNLSYFVDREGFSKPMLPLGRPGLVWIEGMFTIRDPDGRERLAVTYTRQPGLAPPTERGVAVFDDAAKEFRVLAQFPPTRGHTSSHPFRFVDNNVPYLYFYPNQRVPDDWKAVADPKRYESYVCSGSETCSWQASTDRIDASEAIFPLIDADTGTPSGAHPSSTAWNAWRKKWILLSENVGAVYYSEADRPTGPWLRAKKIVSHKAYNFYNVAQHPFFDQDGGRVIYFEGTYTSSFSAAKSDTPRYNYNQIMYRLALDDPRLR